MAEEIIECGVNYLSYERALDLVPPEFIPAYQWFLSMEGQLIPQLPRGSFAPKLSAPIKLASQRGMHSPNYKELPSKGAGKKKYILSVYSVGGSKRFSSSQSVSYEDADMVERPDGTWTVEYASQRAMDGKRHTDKSNEYMMNNLVDGVPVAFMTKEAGGYRIHGLVYVEAYNPITGMFTLHGPVSAESRNVNFYSWLACDGLSEEEQKLLHNADKFDGDAFVAVQAMRRKHQDRFRKAVLSAYDDTCAVTGVATLSALQAAHIDPFSKSQLHAVNNGILLRADVHLLYDAHLLTIRPDGRVVVSEAVKDATYRELDGAVMRFPKYKEYRPDEQLLEINLESYNSCQRKLGLSCA